MLRTGLALLFLLFQVGMIGYCRFDAARYYCWAPHDEQVEYRIEVELGGRRLTQAEVRRRYRDSWGGIEPRAAEHVLRLVRQYEETYGTRDRARVQVLYRVNGSPVRIWRWPPP